MLRKRRQSCQKLNCNLILCAARRSDSRLRHFVTSGAYLSDFIICFKSSEHAANLFGLKEFGNIYTRIMNPTTGCTRKTSCRTRRRCWRFSCCLRAVEVYHLRPALNIAQAGQNIVSTNYLYVEHTTYSTTRFRTGYYREICRFVRCRELPYCHRCQYPARLYRVVGNPKNNVDDFEAIGRIAHDAGIPFIVDNTVYNTGPFKPLQHGADIVVFLLTKFIGGHGTSIGGCVVDGGGFPLG